MDLLSVIRVLLVFAGGVLLLWGAVTTLTPGSLAYRWQRWLLGLTALLSVFAYTRFGGFHEYGAYGRHTYHYHEIFHYYFGAKYYPELGYHKLYDCSYVALQEIGRSGTPVPQINEIRSLEFRNTYRTAGQVFANDAELCRETFGTERWGELRADLRTMLSLGWENGWWKTIFFDLGLNPPPSWAALAYPLANAIPLTPMTIGLLPFLDLTLIFGVAAWLVFTTFGFSALCGYLIVFGNNWLADYVWTGGSFFRQEWFFLLAVGLCFLKRRAFALAGACFGLSAAMRVFPIFFAVGAFLSLVRIAWRDRTRLRDLVHYSAGTAGAGLVMVLFSVAMFRSTLWIEFFQNIVQHNRTLFVMHIGFDKVAVFSRDIASQDFWWGAGLERFATWQARLREIYAQHALFYGAVKVTGLVVALFGAWRCRPGTAALFFGWAMLFFFNVPANYYYVFLALFPLAYVGEGARSLRDTARLVVLFTLVGFLPFPAAMSGDAILYNGYLNWAVLVAFALTAGTMLPSSFYRIFPMIFEKTFHGKKGQNKEDSHPSGGRSRRAS